MAKVTKLDLVYQLKAKGLKLSRYADTDYSRPSLLALLKIFDIYHLTPCTKVTQCCLTKKEMAEEISHAYSRFGLNFNAHEVHYITRDEFILLYNTLIEGVK